MINPRVARVVGASRMLLTILRDWRDPETQPHPLSAGSSAVVTTCNHTGGVDDTGPPQATTALARTLEGGDREMVARTVTITLIPGEPVTGLWCDQCALPSRIEVPLHMLTGLGVSSLKAVIYCTNHD